MLPLRMSFTLHHPVELLPRQFPTCLMEKLSRVMIYYITYKIAPNTHRLLCMINNKYLYTFYIIWCSLTITKDKNSDRLIGIFFIGLLLISLFFQTVSSTLYKECIWTVFVERMFSSPSTSMLKYFSEVPATLIALQEYVPASSGVTLKSFRIFPLLTIWIVLLSVTCKGQSGQCCSQS